MSLSTPVLLQNLQSMMEDVQSNNGSNEKIERLSKYPKLQPFLKLLMDPLQTTGLTSVQLQKYESKNKKTKESTTDQPLKKKSKKVSLVHEEEKDIMVLLQKLYQRVYSGNLAKDVVLSFIQHYPQYKSLVYKIIDKDLELRMDIKQINKAFPGLIGEFSVALAQNYESAERYFKNHSNETWFVSRKYDGIRCIVKINKGEVSAYSRNGIRLPALLPLEKLLKPFSQDLSCVLDGEVCVIDNQGNENFKEAVSNAKRKSVQMESFRYYVFDMLTQEEFDAGEGTRPFSERYKQTHQFITKINQPNYIRCVEQHPLTSMEMLEEWKLKGSNQNWEGLMLRLDTGYKGKRSNDILKVKNFYTEEYHVKGYETGTMRTISEETGLEVVIETLTSVTIEHKGCDVGVGSGFSMAERKDFFKNPKKIVGKMISVRYFEETQDKNGKYSLRFPTFVGFYDQK